MRLCSKEKGERGGEYYEILIVERGALALS